MARDRIIPGRNRPPHKKVGKEVDRRRTHGLEVTVPVERLTIFSNVLDIRRETLPGQMSFSVVSRVGKLKIKTR